MPLTPYDYHLFCCLNERTEGHSRGCCTSRGAEVVFNYLKQRIQELGIERVRVNRAGCLDHCENGPVIVIYPDAAWYKCSSKEQAEQIIQQHLLQGQRVKALENSQDTA